MILSCCLSQIAAHGNSRSLLDPRPPILYQTFFLSSGITSERVQAPSSTRTINHPPFSLVQTGRCTPSIDTRYEYTSATCILRSRYDLVCYQFLSFFRSSCPFVVNLLRRATVSPIVSAMCDASSSLKSLKKKSQLSL